MTHDTELLFVARVAEAGVDAAPLPCGELSVRCGMPGYVAFRIVVRK